MNTVENLPVKEQNIVGFDSHLPRVDVQQWLKGGKAIVVIHDDTEYRLQVTRNKKLILTR